MGAPLLQATGIHAGYGDSRILRGVGLSLEAGQAVGLLGRNGMGKTTLIRSLMGYLRVRDGQVHWQGRPVTNHPPEKMARHGIGYVPEGRGIFPNLSVRENLLMAARTGSDGQQDWSFNRVIATFPRLAERLGHGGQQLSGGEQQMLAIGRALMTNPQVMMLDEATEGLAPLIVAEIWRIIGEIRASGITTLIVDRNWHAVLRHTDHALVLEKGQVVLAGDSRQLLAQPEALARHLGV